MRRIVSLGLLLLISPLQAKVVALAPHIVENLYAIGAGEQILATTAHSDFPEQADALPKVGNYARLQIEKILALQPQYVLVWRGGNPPEDLDRLEQLGLHLVDSNPKSLKDVAQELRKFGKLLGHEKEGERQAAAFEKRLEALRRRYEDKAPLKVFYELWPQPLTTIASGSWPQQVIELCGATNVFADLQGEYPMISQESVLAARPDVIIQPRDSARTIPSVDWSRWPSIPAVKHGAFSHPDADRLHRMTARVLDEAELLCQQLDLLREQ